MWDGTWPASASVFFVHFNPPIPCGMGRPQSAAGLGAASISIHPSRVGWDRSVAATICCTIRFQSTHPVWDGTERKERKTMTDNISIHPSRVGWDLTCTLSNLPILRFQSTHPVWDGTGDWIMVKDPDNISIHPSRVGWDVFSSGGSIGHNAFQSTHPVWDGTAKNI